MAYFGWGEFSSSVFRPVKYGPTVEVSYEDTIDMSDLEIAPYVKDTVAQCNVILSVDNHAKAKETCSRLASSVSYISIYPDRLTTPMTPFMFT